MTVNITRVRITVLVCVVMFRIGAANACESFVDPKGRSVVDFAPLSGFVDNCWRSGVCEMFLSIKSSPYYPVGLFLVPGEWDESRKGSLKGSRKQLFAQLLGPAKNDSVDDFKNVVRRWLKEPIADESESVGRTARKKVYTGVINESDGSISWSFTERTTDREDSTLFEILTGVGSFLKVRGETVLLYVTEVWMPPFEGGMEPNGESTITLSKRWIDCIRDKNR